MVDTMSKHISEMPPTFQQARPDLYIPERLEQVVFKALAKDPNDRHQSMDELRVDLENAIPRPGKSQVLRSAPSDQRSPSELISNVLQGISMKVWAAALVVVVIGGLGALQLRKSTAPQTPVQHETTPANSTTTTTKTAPVTPTATENPQPGTTTPTTTTSTGTAPETAVKPVTTKHQSKHVNTTKTDGNSDTASETASSTAGRRHAYSSAPSYVDMMQTAAADKPKKHKKVRAIAASTSTQSAPSSAEARWNSLRGTRSYTP